MLNLYFLRYGGGGAKFAQTFWKTSSTSSHCLSCFPEVPKEIEKPFRFPSILIFCLCLLLHIQFLLYNLIFYDILIFKHVYVLKY